jgi:WD40 repeat protein
MGSRHSLLMFAVAISVLATRIGARLAKAEEARTLKGHTGAVTAVAFSPDGGTLVSASTDATLKLWDVKNGELRSTLTGHSGAVLCAAFSHDGKTLASGGDDSNVLLWDVAAGKVVAKLSAHGSKVKCLAFSPSGAQLATGGEDMTICLWNVRNRRLRATLKGHTRPVLCVAFAPAGDLLASGSGDQSLKLWNVAQACEQTPGRFLEREPRGSVLSVAYSPDGLELAMTTNSFVAIWELSHPERRFALAARRKGSIWCARYSPQGTLVAAACGANYSRSGRHDGNNAPSGRAPQLKENEIRLWDVATGRELGSLNGHARPVRSLAFSPTGTLLATGSDDKTVMLWDVARYGDSPVLPPVPELSALTADHVSLSLPDSVPAIEPTCDTSALTCDDDVSLLVSGEGRSIPAKPPARKNKGTTRPAGAKGAPKSAQSSHSYSNTLKSTLRDFRDGVVGSGGSLGRGGSGGGGGGKDDGRRK